MQDSSFEYMAGNFEASVINSKGGVTIPPELLGDIVPNYEEGEITAETQAGTVTTPNGKPETSELTLTMFLPKKNATQYLGILFPSSYNEPTAEAQTSGSLVFSSRSCQSRETVAINIHNVCDVTDDNDLYIPAALPKVSFNPTFSTSDAIQVDITIYMMPDENGMRFRFGTGDLSQPSKFDPTTGKTVPVTAETTE